MKFLSQYFMFVCTKIFGETFGKEHFYRIYSPKLYTVLNKKIFILQEKFTFEIF